MRILFIGPHPDDIEIGCAGTVARFIDEGNEVWFHILGKAVVNSSSDEPYQLFKEATKSAETLGVSNIIVDDFSMLDYPIHDYEIRGSFEGTAKEFKPHAVFFPTERDLHQDHIVCSMETQRAFRSNEELYTYETVSSRFGFNPNLFINIEKYITKKDMVLQLFKTQSNKPYFMNKDWMHMASYWAHKSSYSFRTPVEAFEMLRRYM